MKIFYLAAITCLVLGSCTYNVTMAHTSGTADDLIDETSSNTPDISPNLSIPVTP